MNRRSKAEEARQAEIANTAARVLCRVTAIERGGSEPDLMLPELNWIEAKYGTPGLKTVGLAWVCITCEAMAGLGLDPPLDRPAFRAGYRDEATGEIIMGDPADMPYPQYVWAMRVVSVGRNDDAEMLGELLTTGWPDDHEIFAEYLLALLEVCAKTLAALPLAICEDSCDGNH